VFLLICFLIHPWLGLAATVGGIVLFTMALLTERASRVPARTAAQDAGMRSIMVEATRRGGETIVAMGMSESLAQRWARVNNRYIAAVAGLSDVAGLYGSTSKVLRLLLQSMILGLGAYLVIKQELTAGAMIAASIMMGRALAPIETTIANWRAFVAARQSIRRLSDTLARAAPKADITALPPPTRSLDVEQVTIAAPGSAARWRGAQPVGSRASRPPHWINAPRRSSAAELRACRRTSHGNNSKIPPSLPSPTTRCVLRCQQMRSPA
jgi:ATP-binding cassette subfamily C protein